ncbi:MAG: hypothetical protein KBC48_00075 [Candidatus Pacebacteria bacterium]|nr:hypothetical protein [Candidatus Paceibacterota bacterium]
MRRTIFVREVEFSDPEDQFAASIYNDGKDACTGRTKEEAIGKLICTIPLEFDIHLDIPQNL